MNKRTLPAFIAAGLLAAGFAGGAPAQEWQPTFVDGVLQPLDDGFPDRPITLINVDDAGTHSGLYVRAVQEAVKSLSPVDIRISDEPRAAGGTLNTLAEVTTDRDGGKEGYVLVQGSLIGSSTDFLGEPITKETGLTIDDVNFFIATELVPWLVVQRADAPWGPGFASFVDYAKANPGQVKYISGGVGSGLDIFMTWVLDQAGVEVNKIPAPDREAAIAAVAGGAGDVNANNVPNTLSAAERVDVILVSTPGVPDAFAGEGVISATEYAEYGLDDVLWGSHQGFLVSREVPDEHVAWVHALLEAGTKTDIYQKRMESQPGLVIKVLSTEDANAAARKAVAAAEPIMRAAGLLWDQNQ